MNTHEELKAILLDILDVREEAIKPDAKLEEDLQIESIDMVDVATACESKFGIELRDEDLASIKTVQDVVDYIERHKKG